MKHVLMGMACLALAFGAQAEAPMGKGGSCEEKAVSKTTGKPLAGAAKTKFMQKCEADAKAGMGASDCAARAVGSNGKPLGGAARASFMKQCEAGGK